MKKILLVFTVLCAAAAFAAAQDQGSQAPGDDLTAALQEISAAQLGTLTVADIVRVAGRMSVAAQAQAYVRHAAVSSLVLPGAGQFMTGDTLGGVLFLAGDLAVITGTVLGWYFLLPANLQFTSLDYLNTPIETIRTTWHSHTINDYLPSFGVAVGGMALRGILGYVSARLASKEARNNIASGKVQFTPRLGFTGNGFMMGFGLRM